jgi:ABC-2 type transport system ATP-binding protein
MKILDNTVVVRELKKKYGQLEAVKGISFDIKKGEIFALIGPNGAGKTSALRMVATILKPDAGTIEVCGIDALKEPSKVRELISYLPEEAGAYKNLTGLGYLKFMASLFSKSNADEKKYVAKASEICALGDRLTNKIGTYSKGMTRKLLLARAVMTSPKLAILDEPTSGLDVINALEIRKLIRSLADEGMSVLVSSHNMLEIEFLSDRVSIIDHGVIFRTGTPEELKKKNNAGNLEEVFMEVAQ